MKRRKRTSSSGVFVHPQALCESVDVGRGTRVWAFAHVMKGARVGRDCNIGDHAFVEEGAVVGDGVTIKNGVLIWDGVTVEDDVFLGPGVVFTNDLNPRAAFKKGREEFLATTVRTGATLGAGAVVVCGVAIGENALVGAGAVVLHDVPAHALVVGNPARQVGWACACGQGLEPVLTCASCGRSYELTEGALVAAGARGELMTAPDTATDGLQLWPPGHFHSPVPSLAEVRRREARVFRVPQKIEGIDLLEAEQLALVDQFQDYYAEQPFPVERSPGLRYYFSNDFFSYGDGLMLYCMLRHVRPRRVVEVGSGFSSAMILDVNEQFLGQQARCSFIEPYPERLLGLLRPTDRTSTTLAEVPLQDADPQVFMELEAGDVLFIDSSHVSKVGSDVNELFFEILPQLKAGVYVHFHDIFYPFEYPAAWVYQGRAWNESYLLRAFLMYNPRFRIVLFNSYLAAFHHDYVAERLPLWAKNPGGSLWLQRVE